MTIWKYLLELTDEQTVNMPRSAEVLHVGIDPNGSLCVWALVDPNTMPEDRVFFVHGTGFPVPSGRRHLGSVTLGPFVWHVFEPSPEEPAS